MKKQNENLTDAAILRQKAEEILKARKDKSPLVSDASNADTLKLIHELQVHQIELEMQNEELVIAKEKAELAEEKYTELYDFAPSGYLSLTKEGVIAELNFVAARMLGQERSKLTKKRFDFSLSIDTQTTFNLFLHDIFTSKVKQSCEVTIATEGNLPIYVTIEGIVSQNGELCSLTLIDITKRILAEEQLRFQAHIIDNSPVIAAYHDKDLNMQWANKAYQKTTGLSLEEIKGRKCYEVWNLSKPCRGCPVIAAIETGVNAAHELTPDNQEHWPETQGYWLSQAAPVRDKQGVIIGATEFAIDITERKNAERLIQGKSEEIAAQNEELKQANVELIAAKEHAEESDRLKSAFLTNMSHEIRTPMNGILGFSELLKEPGLTGERQQEYIRIIEKSGARMLNIINDIVDISKIEANLMNVDIKDSNINEIMEFIYIFFKPQVEEKGMHFRFKNSLPTKEAIIRTDSEKVYSILTNLVKNAIKYSREGEIEFGYLKKDDFLEFYVKDTGIGIPNDRQEAIFKRFIQADIEDRMAYKGAGLGLAITKAYVGMLGGKIWVESEEGIGSTFYFTLPYNSEPKKETIDPQPASSEKNDTIRKLKILVAEDDEVSEMLLDVTVKMFGKEILKARTGIEAIEACRNNADIDLILMDIRMPDMGGYEATKQIREFNREVIIIAQTAYGLTGDRDKAIEAGCNDYIAKPINKIEIQALIQKYFGE